MENIIQGLIYVLKHWMVKAERMNPNFKYSLFLQICHENNSPPIHYFPKQIVGCKNSILLKVNHPMTHSEYLLHILYDQLLCRDIFILFSLSHIGYILIAKVNHMCIINYNNIVTLYNIFIRFTTKSRILKRIVRGAAYEKNTFNCQQPR